MVVSTSFAAAATRVSAVGNRTVSRMREASQTTTRTDAGRKAGRRVLKLRGEVDAVVCAADVLAIGLVTTLNRAGVAVPGEVAVTAFDDTAILEVLDPPLTSIRHPLDAMADHAVALLHADADEREERVERFAPELVVRASSGTGR